MKNMLHILTRKEDDLARLFINSNPAGFEFNKKDDSLKAISLPDVSIFDLSLPNPDYEQLVRDIFNADSVAVW